MLYPGPYPDKTGSYLSAELPEAVAAGAYAYDDGSGLIQLFWPEGLGGPPSVATVEAWGPAPVTDVERTYQKISEKLNGDEEARTGKKVDPKGAVPTARAMAATSMLVNAWNYPSESDLETDINKAILEKIYADPTMKTNADSSVNQKQKVLHFTLVMLEGQAFGLQYQSELGAYERTASGQFLAALDGDKRDWLSLPCPMMNKPLPAYETVKAMFQAIMG